MSLYRSRPQEVEAVQWTGTSASFTECVSAIPGKVRASDPSGMSLLAGKDGVQEWVPVPVGHWLVHAPGDLSDVWPVDPDYFVAKYEPGRVAAALNGTPDLTAVQKVVADALLTISNDWQPTNGPGFPITREESLRSMSWTIARALVASTGTETDDE